MPSLAGTAVVILWWHGGRLEWKMLCWGAQSEPGACLRRGLGTSSTLWSVFVEMLDAIFASI